MDVYILHPLVDFYILHPRGLGTNGLRRLENRWFRAQPPVGAWAKPSLV